MNVHFVGLELRDDGMGMTHVHWHLQYFGEATVSDNPACEHEPGFRGNLLRNIEHIEQPWPLPACLRCLSILIAR